MAVLIVVSGGSTVTARYIGQRVGCQTITHGDTETPADSGVDREVRGRPDKPHGKVSRLEA